MKAATTALAAGLLALAVQAGDEPAGPARLPAGVTLSPLDAASAAARASTTASDVGTATRDAVRRELAAARAAGTLMPDGEIGDTPRVLAAREARDARIRAASPDTAERRRALEVATATAVRMSGADAIADAEVYEMTDADGALVGFLFRVEDEDADPPE